MSDSMKLIEAAGFEPLAVVATEAKPVRQLHLVHQHAGEVVSLLCGRRTPQDAVERSGASRRHRDMCYSCYRRWTRGRERAAA